MVSQKVIKGVLGNFLGTYTSRYSDFDGYWLFGCLVSGLAELQIDLRARVLDESITPVALAVRLAVVKFGEQCEKAGLLGSQIQDASLVIRKLPDRVLLPVNGRPSLGYNLNFTATALMESGKRYEREQVVFVAPHDAKVEQRSGRAT